VNVPTLPLMFLEPGNQVRFEFRRRGEELIDGVPVPVLRIDYRETAPATIIRTAAGGDVPASGSFWIDPATGRVVRTRLATHLKTVEMDATVTYKPNEALGLWVPATMRESYDYVVGSITGVATYSHFRRFQVLIDEQVKIPK
jgi:hypothetical protein